MIIDMCMTRGVETVTPETSLGDAVRRMNARNIRRLVVVKGRAVVGMICRQDVVRAFPENLNPFSVASIDALPDLGTVAEFMHSPVITIEADQPIEAAARRMTEHHIGGLPVVQGEKLAGIITESDIFRAFTRMLAPEGVLRVTVGFLETKHGTPAFADFVARAGGTLVGFQSHPRPGGQRLYTLRMSGGSKEALLEALSIAGCQLMEVLDARDAGAA